MDPIEVASTEIINALAVLCTVKALATFRGTLVILTGSCMLSQIHSVLLVVTSTSCFQVPLGSLKALYHETFSSQHSQALPVSCALVWRTDSASKYCQGYLKNITLQNVSPSLSRSQWLQFVVPSTFSASDRTEISPRRKKKCSPKSLGKK